MKIIKQVGIIFAITAVGVVLNKTLPLPVPAGVYGMFLLLILLLTGTLKLKAISTVSDFLVENMTITFIAPAVAIIDRIDDIRPVLIPFIIICIVSTILVILATGWVSQWIIRRKKIMGRQKQDDSVCK